MDETEAKEEEQRKSVRRTAEHLSDTAATATEPSPLPPPPMGTNSSAFVPQQQIGMPAAPATIDPASAFPGLEETQPKRQKVSHTGDPPIQRQDPAPEIIGMGDVSFQVPEAQQGALGISPMPTQIVQQQQQQPNKSFSFVSAPSPMQLQGLLLQSQLQQLSTQQLQQQQQQQNPQPQPPPIPPPPPQPQPAQTPAQQAQQAAMQQQYLQQAALFTGLNTGLAQQLAVQQQQILQPLPAAAAQFLMPGQFPMATTTAAGAFDTSSGSLSVGTPLDASSVGMTAAAAVAAASAAAVGGQQGQPQDSSGDHGITGRAPIVLYMTCDDDALSEYQCLVRKNIELFEAQHRDVESNAQGRNRPIVLGQCGIRCRHCSMLPPKHRARGAVYYPAKLEGLYQAAQNQANGHLAEHCNHVPAPIREELLRLKDRKSSAGGGKKYWADGVRVLGVYEDANGLRFERR